MVTRMFGIAAASTTLFFWTPLMDPINLPKFTVVAVLSLLIFCGVLIHSKKIVLTRSFFLVVALALAFLVSAFVSDQHYASIWGGHGRNNGLVSYLALLLYFFAATLLLRKELSVGILRTLVFTGGAVGLYALLQLLHWDWVEWDNPFNPAVTTLGNPNFTAGLLGIWVAALFAAGVMQPNIKLRLKYIASASAATIVIWFTDSIQGIFAAVAAIGVFFSLYWLRRKVWIGVTLFSVGLASGIFIFWSFIGEGPLGDSLKQQTLLIRMNYWRAAIRMFLDHPWAGVGLDRYGAYFQFYRDERAIETGNLVVADAAHNVFLQFAATGGLPLVLSYLALQIFVFVTVVKRFWRDGFEPLDTALFAAWLAFQFQSLVSIDQLGITVWGWVIGGALLARDSWVVTEPKRSKHPGRAAANTELVKSSPLRVGISATVGISGAIWLLSNLGPMWRADDPTPNLPVRDGKVVLSEAAESLVGHRPADPYYYKLAARFLNEQGDPDLGAVYADKALKLDPRLFEMWMYKADYAKFKNDVPGELAALKKARELDPLNTDLIAREAALKQ